MLRVPTIASLAAAFLLPLALAARTARADDAAANGGQPRKPEAHTEIDFVPLAGGSSDIGIGGGVVGAITRFAENTENLSPGNERAWDWRVEGNVFATFGGSTSLVPYQDHWIKLTMPRLVGGRVRVISRLAFTQETNVHYFGVGDATPAPANESAPAFVYGRTHPLLEGYVRGEVASHLFVEGGLSFTFNRLDVPVDGKLASDMRSPNEELRSLLGTAQNHAVGLLVQSVVWDDRDDQVIPRSGSWDEVDLRLSPEMGTAFPYPYGEVLAIGRIYLPVGDRVVVAARGLVDALFGSPPFYQLTEYDDTYAIGGTAGVRGVPAEQYYGRIKVIANLEVRTDAARFQLFGKPWAFGIATFLDGGRLWADWSPQPQLDGTGLGLKWGTGAGIRVQQGKAFVVRGDVAWSPDARPIGGYFAAGEAF
jgi:hypothetical protein